MNANLLSFFRQLLESIGGLLKRIEASFVLSVIIAGFTTLQRIQVLGLTTQAEIISVIPFLLGIVIGSLIVFQVLGVGCIWLSEKIPLCINIEATNDIDSKTDIDEKDKSVTFHNYAFLKITNKEHSEITNCYAVVKNIELEFSEFAMNIARYSRRLKWKKMPANDECSIKIGRADDAILHVYQISTKSDIEKLVFFDFCFCDTPQRSYVRTVNKKTRYNLEIDIHGNIVSSGQSKEVIKKWKGYFEIEPLNNDLSFRFFLKEGWDNKKKKIP